jgi:putative transposase
LEGLNVEMDWPMSGKPRLLYLDNAAEFKSEALRRGCEQHGIRLDYRPLGQPHYGGIVERIIGTAMQMIHDELPGTTFSNPDQRGEYASEKMAALTLRELLAALAVGTYHGLCTTACSNRRPRAGPKLAPDRRANRHHSRHGFSGDFLPIIRRTLTRTGFVIDHIHYADALKPWIARRPLACVPDPARPARHQPHLGAGAGGPALPGNSLPYLVAPGCHPLGTTTGAGEIAAARARTGG